MAESLHTVNMPRQADASSDPSLLQVRITTAELCEVPTFLGQGILRINQVKSSFQLPLSLGFMCSSLEPSSQQPGPGEILRNGNPGADLPVRLSASWVHRRWFNFHLLPAEKKTDSNTSPRRRAPPLKQTVFTALYPSLFLDPETVRVGDCV